MIEWNKYQRADGEWAEVGAFILEASVNGSWVVRHKLAMIPCRCSADIGARQPGGIDAAKASCERVLGEIVAEVKPDEAVEKQRRITVALCERYVAARAMGPEEQHTALAELDRRVLGYLENNR